MRIRLICSVLLVLMMLVVVPSVAQTATSFGAGIHLVGVDIEPGLYRSLGQINYFARLSGITGEFSDIIANAANPPPPVLIEIKPTDVAFESKGSGHWNIVDDSYQPEPVVSFGAGWWLVGRDIVPGIYRKEGGVNYFARLSGLGAELQDIIANGSQLQGPVLVEIKASDLAFQSKTEGLWVLIDDSYRPHVRNTFGDGYWIINRDIMPGIYRTEDYVQYYARLSGFGNELDDIIVNAASVMGGVVIEIADSDVGFLTKGGAQWTQIEIEPRANRLTGILLLLLDE